MKKDGSFHWAWIILGTCFVNLFINYSIRLGYGVILPEMIRSLNFSRTAGGSIYNAYLFSYIVLTPIAGFLTDKLGARRVIACCSLILGIGVLLMARASTLWEACVFYSIVGAGAAGMWTPLVTVVQRWFAPNRRGFALGIMSTGYGLGFAAMGAVFPWIVHHFNWRYAWYFLGAGALVMTAVNAFLLRSDPEESGQHPWGEHGSNPSGPLKKAPPKKPALWFHIVKNRSFWLIGLSYFSISYSLYGITTFMVDFAKSQMGLPLEKASLLATIHGVSQVAGVLTILPLSDRIGRRNTIALSNGFITIALTGLLFAKTPMTLYLIVGLLAVFYGATFPVYGASAGDYFPKEVLGTVIGAWTPFYGIGAILSHWATGLLRDRTGVYDQAFMLTAMMAGTALILILFLRKTVPGRETGKD